MIKLQPVVLPEDREAVIAANSNCLRKKNGIYAQHRVNAKLAYLKELPELLEASAEWEECGDLLVSTQFDLIHFDAQIKRGRKLGNDVTFMEKTREEVRRRHKRAKKRFPQIVQRLERLHAKAVQKKLDTPKPFSIVEDDECPPDSE